MTLLKRNYGEKSALASAVLEEAAPTLEERLLLLPASKSAASTALATELHQHANFSPSDSLKSRTVFYLAYGSNLSAETFLRKRAIKPLSAVNVAVPCLRLTFDLPGVPYLEPCFANTADRIPDAVEPRPVLDNLQPLDYHKDRWHKPLVGVVYELTQSDFAHVIATEGGGASYQDIVVDCYPLAEGSNAVPLHPDGTPINAHTLFAPANTKSGRVLRPDPAYAQPSRRYMDLLISGAAEHSLPQEYREYLSQIRSYTVTSLRQRCGKAIIMICWAPLMLSVMKFQGLFQDKHGRNPKWLSGLLTSLFIAVWANYDSVLRPLFGDGERTEYVKNLAMDTGRSEKA